MQLGLTFGVRRAVQLSPHGCAVADGARHFSWVEFADRVARLAGGLRGLGVTAGDRVALLALNSHRSVECYFAVLHAGGVMVPLNHRLAAHEIAAQLVDAEPVVLLVDAAYLDLLGDLRTGYGGVFPRVVVGDLEGDYEALLASAPVEDADRSGDDLACLFYTGGTTGAPKGVMLSHANIMANSVNFLSHIGTDERLVHLHCGPLFHVAAGVRLFSTTQVGGTHVMLPRFTAGGVLAAIARERVTLATFVPTMLRALLDDPGIGTADLSSLRTVTYGAAPMPEALLREAMARLPGVHFVQSYGMTETSPIATMLGWRDHGVNSGRLRSAGQAALLAEITIADENGAPLPRGAFGEILIRGPMVMLGYWRQPEATAQALRDGWMRSGDVGYLDDAGYLFVVDRLKDVIISGGENVHSQEVENVIAAHPSVRECAVLGRPDARWGEAVHAVVVPRAGMAVTPAEILAHCKARMAGFKCPRSIDIRLEPLPLSGTNKILKRQLRDALVADEMATANGPI